MPRDPSSDTGRRFVETTLELIAEEGGSLGVNLRQISRRMGCAHTNVYNYFGSYQELLWAAFRQAIAIYGEHIIAGLGRDMAPARYLQQSIGNLASFPQENPGLYRFVASDPIELADIPADILETVTAMKRWLGWVVAAAAGLEDESPDARDAADIILAYLDGETLNIINGRAVPDEDLEGRVVANALRLFDLLRLDAGRPAGSRRQDPSPPEPRLIFGH